MRPWEGRRGSICHRSQTVPSRAASLPQNSRSAPVASGKGTPPLQVPERWNCSQPGHICLPVWLFVGAQRRKSVWAVLGVLEEQAGAETSLIPDCGCQRFQDPSRPGCCPGSGDRRQEGAPAVEFSVLTLLRLSLHCV